MLNLVLNENMKIYRRMRTWIMIGVLIVLVVMVSLIAKNILPANNDNWKADLTKKITENTQNLKNSRIPENVKPKLQEEIKIDQYAIDHNIPPVENTLWGAVKNLKGLIFVVTIMVVIAAGDTVAGEFSTGTIKLLLIRPFSRTKVLLSKYISSFLFALFLLVILFVSGFVFNTILYGLADVNLPYLHMGNNGTVVEVNLLGNVLYSYGLACVQLIMIVTLAFMISTVFRSSILAICLSIVAMLVGGTVVGLLNTFTDYTWIKYILFANTDLTQYIEGTPLIEGMTMQFSLMVLAVYFIIFNALSWYLFKKRDVAA